MIRLMTNQIRSDPPYALGSATGTRSFEAQCHARRSRRGHASGVSYLAASASRSSSASASSACARISRMTPSRTRKRFNLCSCHPLTKASRPRRVVRSLRQTWRTTTRAATMLTSSLPGSQRFQLPRRRGRRQLRRHSSRHSPPTTPTRSTPRSARCAGRRRRARTPRRSACAPRGCSSLPATSTARCSSSCPSS
jgi:hypothetical protein